jgi:hypothetical protein
MKSIKLLLPSLLFIITYAAQIVAQADNSMNYEFDEHEFGTVFSDQIDWDLALEEIICTFDNNNAPQTNSSSQGESSSSSSTAQRHTHQTIQQPTSVLSSTEQLGTNDAIQQKPKRKVNLPTARQQEKKQKTNCHTQKSFDSQLLMERYNFPERYNYQPTPINRLNDYGDLLNNDSIPHETRETVINSQPVFCQSLSNQTVTTKLPAISINKSKNGRKTSKPKMTMEEILRERIAKNQKLHHPIVNPFVVNNSLYATSQIENESMKEIANIRRIKARNNEILALFNNRK